MLNIEDSLLLIIDIQDKLVKASKDSETIAKKSSMLGAAARILKVPTIVTEQYPQGLGATVDELKTCLAEDVNFFEKTSFSALSTISEELVSKNRKQIILCGIEAHICVYQTCLELLEKGYDVYIVKDACSSRNDFEYQTGLDLMKQAGAKLTCVETVLFELLKTSKHPDFKSVQALIK